MKHERIQDRMRGRWKSVLPLLGIDSRHLTGKHGPCPLCTDHGTDRFRFDDKGGNGTWICNQCGAGNGVDLVMKLRGVIFIEAVKLLEQHIGDAPIIIPKASKSELQRESDQRDQMAYLWSQSRALDGQDLASRYLHSRGIKILPVASAMRLNDGLLYWVDAKSKLILPTMLAKFAAPDGQSAILHRTYLAEPGNKADVEKPRQLMPGKVPPGGAVRLTPAAETMGIAEGIETALSASQLFDIPVWAALTAGALMKWQPPSHAKFIIVFGDNDESMTGQAAAYSLAHRLKIEGFAVEVRLPAELGADWNDQLSLETSSPWTDDGAKSQELAR
jgi:putative DNA primase/helicase